MRPVSIALVHHPVLGRDGGTVTSAITNLDVHDLARSARTYGCHAYFIVHPIAVQRALVERICDHWQTGSSGLRIPDRKDALALVRPTETLESAIVALGGRDRVDVWITAARDVRPPLAFAEARDRIARDDGRHVLIVFGTSWGLTAETIAGADEALPPIRAKVDAGYAHLSVRAAAAIALDRLLGG